jgi:hypothetical protein
MQQGLSRQGSLLILLFEQLLQLSISPTEHHLAIASLHGDVHIVSITSDTHSLFSSSSSSSRNAPVTAMCWNGDGRKLFVGDALGAVTCTLMIKVRGAV